MPLYKVPSPSSSSLSDSKKSRGAAPGPPTFSPDFPSSTSSSSTSGSVNNFGAFSDEDSGFVEGIRAGGGRMESSFDGHQRAPHSHQNGHGSSYPHHPSKRSTDSTGGLKTGSALPDQQVSIVELEILQQTEREAELAAMRQSIYSQTSPQNTLSHHHHPQPTPVSTRPSAVDRRILPPSSSDPRPPRPSPDDPRQRSAKSPSSHPYGGHNSSSALNMTYEEAISVPSHPGESLIAREIMELKQKEEELRRRRAGLPMDVTSSLRESSVDDDVDSSSSARDDVTVAMTRGSSSSRDDRRPTTKRQPPRIQPLEAPGETEAFVPQDETPIEREMRQLKERENALRQARGLPVDDGGNDGGVEVALTAGGGGMVRRGAAGDQKTDQTMKKLANSMLMLEIEKEKQREMEVRHHSQQHGHHHPQPPTTSAPARTNAYYNRRY